MSKSNTHNSFDAFDDEKLRNSVIKHWGYLEEERYLFSKNLCTELIKQGKTKADLVSLTKISKSAITNYTKGYRIPTPQQLTKITFALGITSDKLLGRTQSKDISAIEVEYMLGLTENAMKVFYGLNHNTLEVQDLMDKMPLSNEHKNKLNIFSLFVENSSKFIDLLGYFERFVNIKQKLNNCNKSEKESLQNDLIRYRRNNYKIII